MALRSLLMSLVVLGQFAFGSSSFAQSALCPNCLHGNKTPNTYNPFAPGPWLGSYPYTFGSPSYIPSCNTYFATDQAIYAVAPGFSPGYRLPPPAPPTPPNPSVAPSLGDKLDDFYLASGVPFSFYNMSGNVLNEMLAAGDLYASGRVRIVHGVQLGGFFTLFLPATWTPNGTQTYPIAAEANYDVNANIFAGFGEASLIARTVAQSTLNGGTGVIGLIWNGGGVHGSVTANALAIQQFADIVNWVSTTTRGNKHNIYMIGKSRGATAPLLLASGGHPDYTIRFVVAIAPGTKFGTHIQNISFTMPGQLGGLSNGTGYSSSWEPGWTFPGSPGLTAREKMANTVLCDTLASLDSTHSPISPAKLQNLLNETTKVLLIVGSHDPWIPFGTQLEYLQELRAKGIPVEAHVVLRGGHLRVADLLSGFFDPVVPGRTIGNRFKDNVLVAMQVPTFFGNVNSASLTDSIVYYDTATISNSYADPMRITTLTPNSPVPFTFEIPYRLYDGVPLHAFVTGPKDTQVRLTVVNVGIINLTIGQSDPTNTRRLTEFVVAQPDASWPGNPLQFIVEFKPPGASTFTTVTKASGCNPVANAGLLTYRTAGLPHVSSGDLTNPSSTWSIVNPLRCASWPDTNWGVTQSF